MLHLVRKGFWILSLLGLLAPALAQEGTQGNPSGALPNRVSPVRKIENRLTERPPVTKRGPLYRSIDGTGNNPYNPLMGATFTQLRRAVPSDYADGISQLAGPDRPSARAISNAICSQAESLPNKNGLSDYVWQWGQFVDHDIDLTEGLNPPEAANIPIPTGDPQFDPEETGTAEMEFNRSICDLNTGNEIGSPRQQINEITAWLDGSNVYGSNEQRASALRTNDGTGRMKTGEFGLFLPYNEAGFPNAGGSGPELFLAGDVRANEQCGLTALHILFVREHNRLAALLKFLHPQWDGEEIYQRARRWVGAEIQAITYNEFLPALLGTELPPYQGYNSQVDASITNLFSTSVYRFGHSAVNGQFLRLDQNLDEIPEGPLPLRNAFFAPNRIIEEGGIAPLLRGMAYQASQDVDPFEVDDIRNFLFGPPGAGGFDLASLNIQRGRDHGLPCYTAVRAAYGLDPVETFADISSNPDIQARLAATYQTVDDIDLWVGTLAEDHLPGALVGELAAKVIAEQFSALRDGDRFWYTRVLDPLERFLVDHTTLADIIRYNTSIGDEISDDVFRLPN